MPVAKPLFIQQNCLNKILMISCLLKQNTAQALKVFKAKAKYYANCLYCIKCIRLKSKLYGKSHLIFKFLQKMNSK